MRTRDWIVAIACAALLAGCARQQSVTTTTRDSTMVDTAGGGYGEPGTRTSESTGQPVTPDTAAATPAADRPKIDTSSPTATLLSKLRQQEFDLGVMVQEKRLEEIPAKAASIRSLASQAVAGATDLPADKRSDLVASMRNVRSLTAKLATAAQGGDASLVTVVFKDLEDQLRAMEGILQG